MRMTESTSFSITSVISAQTANFSDNPVLQPFSEHPWLGQQGFDNLVVLEALSRVQSLCRIASAVTIPLALLELSSHICFSPEITGRRHRRPGRARSPGRCHAAGSRTHRSIRQWDCQIFLQKWKRHAERTVHFVGNPFID